MEAFKICISSFQSTRRWHTRTSFFLTIHTRTSISIRIGN
jgi:hypothetical protein